MFKIFGNKVVQILVTLTDRPQQGRINQPALDSILRFVQIRSEVWTHSGGWETSTMKIESNFYVAISWKCNYKRDDMWGIKWAYAFTSVILSTKFMLRFGKNN